MRQGPKLSLAEKVFLFMSLTSFWIRGLRASTMKNEGDRGN
jgi:hypothetical protein